MVSFWSGRGRERLRHIAPQQLLVAIDRLQTQHLSDDGTSAVFDELLAGVVVLAGRPGGYDEELVDFLRPLLLTATVVLHARRQRREFHHRGEQLRHTEQHLRDVLASLHDVAWSFTLPDGKMVYLSP